MANNIDWGKIYLTTWFGNTGETAKTIPVFSAPQGWLDFVDFTVDRVQTFIDITRITIDKTTL